MSDGSAPRKARIIPIVPHGKMAASGGGSGLEFRHALPLALYVHIPWCVQKCPYCDFNSHEARGDGGFGYDPYFLLPDLGVTAAELDAAEKNRRSHRGLALQQLIERLKARRG